MFSDVLCCVVQVYVYVCPFPEGIMTIFLLLKFLTEIKLPIPVCANKIENKIYIIFLVARCTYTYLTN